MSDLIHNEPQIPKDQNALDSVIEEALIFAVDHESELVTPKNDYERLVTEAAAHASGESLSNGLPSHGMYLLRTFLSRARDTVRIFAGNLRCISSIQRDESEQPVALYADPKVLASIYTALGRGVTISIILERPIDDALGPVHPVIAIAQRAREAGFKGRLTIRQLSEEGVVEVKKHNIDNHLMVMDSQAFRLEFDSDKCKARAGFGLPSYANTFSQLFDLVLSRWATTQVFPRN